ncbi:hypothetical protein LBMAG52_29440 [Planctomycetia bacterium]|nr:hypothetical protein LBMAG52_29440 [Planctomycetia bacterium]
MSSPLEAQPIPASPVGACGRPVWARWLWTIVVALLVAGLAVVKSASPLTLFGGAAIGLLLLGLRGLIVWKTRRVQKLFVIASVFVLAAVAVGVRTHWRYQVADSMTIPIREYLSSEYSEDPADRALAHGSYQGRKLLLVKKDETHFDFVLEPTASHIAKIVFKNVDVSRLTPSLPEWTKSDSGLRRIALTDRQWNRQQVKFDLKSDVEVTGGDGFEAENLFSAELAKNCLNAGLWEVLLFTKGASGKTLYYQGWFTFPLGHYQRLFERNTGLKFNDHWYYLEHWFDPAGTVVNLDGLRRVTSERDAETKFDPAERLIFGGEQTRKRRTTTAPNVLTWRDFFDGRSVTFASFIPPGKYSSQHPHGNDYQRLDKFQKSIVRSIVSPASPSPLLELELLFQCSKGPGTCRFFVSGLDPAAIPQLPVADYSQGTYMPMGIGVPPFFQSYADLQKRAPETTPFFSVLLDDAGRWIDHHALGIDGPVLHRDANDPNLLHLYLLAYERHSLVAHFVISLPMDLLSESGGSN